MPYDNDNHAWRDLVDARKAAVLALALASILHGCAGAADTQGAPSLDAGTVGGVGTVGGAEAAGAGGARASQGATGGAASPDGGTAGDGGVPQARAGAGGSSGGSSSGGGAGADTGGGGAAQASGGASAGGASGGQGPMQLVHPGILNSASELAAIKSHVAAHAEPWASAFKALEASAYGSLAYAAKPYVSVECGSYNKPNIGCSQMVDDGMAAYAHALIWNATGDSAHAAKAIGIIDAWAKTYRRNLESNSRLVVAWATPWYANAAEILRYSNAGWSNDVQQRFAQLLSLWLPYVSTDDPPLNNWIQSRIEAHFAIAVFHDEPEELAKAVARWKKFLPTYVLDDGLCSETCRDLGHAGLGIRSLLYAAETAWQQGLDLFSPNQARLAKFIELHGPWMLGRVPVPSDVCGGVIKAAENDGVGISPPNGGGSMPLEILYAQLHERLHVALPNAEEMIRRARPLGGGHWVLKWETLTHAVPL